MMALRCIFIKPHTLFPSASVTKVGSLPQLTVMGMPYEQKLWILLSLER